METPLRPKYSRFGIRVYLEVLEELCARHWNLSLLAIEHTSWMPEVLDCTIEAEGWGLGFRV